MYVKFIFNIGIEYNMGRIPIASCDFSPRVYSYDDTANDFNLEHFSLADEDHKFKVIYTPLHCVEFILRTTIY